MDYCVLEAIVFKARREKAEAEREAEERRKREEWKKDTSELEKLR